MSQPERLFTRELFMPFLAVKVNKVDHEGLGAMEEKAIGLKEINCSGGNFH